ncbi:MAG: proline dehydrogenase family protein [Akkermansia sp.]|nr:proline dehydrogenase family protein [Akkermansia sp.]
MGALDITSQLADAKKRKPDDRSLAQQAAALAQELLIAGQKEMRSDERTLLSALHRMVADEKNCRFVQNLCARVLHLSDPAEQAANLRTIITDHGGIPSIFSTFGKIRFKTAAMASHGMQGAAIAEVQRIFRSTFGGLTLPTQVDKITKRVKECAKDHIRLTLKPLAPEVFGNKSAERYFHRLETILKRPESVGIVVQPLRLCPELSPYSPKESAKRLADKLKNLIKLASESNSPRTILVESGNSLILEIVAEGVRIALSSKSSQKAHLMLEIPAYLKKSPAILREMTEWATSRSAKGAQPFRPLLVKGSDLTHEQELQARHGEASAVSRNKAETETRFKKLIHTAISSSPKAIAPVIGSHNLYDIAYALLDWGRSGRDGLPDFCFICGLADHTARLLGKNGANITLSAPLTEESGETGFESYLMNLVQELARPDGFISAGASPATNSMEWGRMRQQFLAALSGREESNSETSRPNTNKSSFIPTPVSKLTDSVRIETLLKAAEEECERQQSNIPLLINGEETTTALSGISRSLTAPGMEDYRFTAADFSAVDKALTLATQAAVQMQPQQDELRIQLLKAARELEKRETRFISLLVRDAGCTLSEADMELRNAIDACRFYEQSIISPGLQDGTLPTPLGVVVVATDRVHPLASAMAGIAAAWVTGNTVIYKPSFHSILIASELTSMLRELGFEEPRLQMLPCPDNQIADMLMCDERVNGLIFYGNRRNATAMQNRNTYRPVLTGNPGYCVAYVASSADWHKAIPELTEAAIHRAGQGADTPNIILVHAAVYDNQAFINAFKDAVNSRSARPGYREGGQLGPMLPRPTPEQNRLLTETEKGETWLVQPHTEEIGSQIWHPGLLTGVLPGSIFTQEAHNVPIIGLMRVNDTREATALQADMAGSTSAIIYSLDEAEIATWSKRLFAGNLSINCAPLSQPGVLPSGSWHTATPKTLGPNFLTTLSSWQEQARPQSRPSHRNVPFAPWEALSPKPTPDETTRLAAAADSIAYWWEKEFGIVHELNRTPLTLTTLAYHPIPVCLRAEKIMTDVDLSIMLMGALKAGCRVQLSTASLRAWMPRSLEPLGVDIIVEGREEFENRFSALAADGIHVRDVAASAATIRAAADCRLKLCSDSILANARLELLHYLREQVITRCSG